VISIHALFSAGSTCVTTSVQTPFSAGM
jgi:hypothetical protein